MPRDVTAGIVRNIFTLRALENALAKDVTDEFLIALFADLAAQIARIDPTAPAAKRFRDARLAKLLDEVASRVGSGFDDVHRTLRGELARIGAQQATFAASQLSRAIGNVGVEITTKGIGLNLMKSILDSEPFRGAVLRDWSTRMAENTVFRVHRQVQLGMAQNEGVDDIVRRVRGRSVGRGRFSGGVMDTTTREATALVRTAVNHVANEGHRRIYTENADVVARVRFVATLDSRTSEACMGLDGTEWDVGSGDIRQPPLHFNCRSVLLPVVDWKGLGLDPPAESTRASSEGQVPSSTTYGQWLRDRSAAEQDEILGRAKAKLFRAGKINLRELVATDGRVKRVDELAA